ncbi:MAG: GNAT family N-acetyltransferase [Tannerella sp.]|jgi:ribosomal protein S18 acetylase RimI-like enzyme|nr:GNAT family N-acetyltransferase [Tannerella sp.]
MIPTEINVTHCDYGDPSHLQAVATLINTYIRDEMGGGEPLSKSGRFRLVDGLQNSANAIVLLAMYRGSFCGLLVAFENFSTFTAQPMINIHDIFVPRSCRRKGAGRKLMNALIAEARERRCSRITLEVRHDNAAAQHLYRDMGFDDTNPPMYYWRKQL